MLSRLDALFMANLPFSAIHQHRWRLGILGLSLLIGLVATACVGGASRPVASDFSLPLFDGGDFRLSDQQGKVAILYFWYPTCPPCRAEMPDLEKVWQKHKDSGEVVFLGIFIPTPFDSEEDARSFVRGLNLTSQFATDDSHKVAIEYELVSFPTTFFITRDGHVFRRWEGKINEATLSNILQFTLEAG